MIKQTGGLKKKIIVLANLYTQKHSFSFPAIQQNKNPVQASFYSGIIKLPHPVHKTLTTSQPPTNPEETTPP